MRNGGWWNDTRRHVVGCEFVHLILCLLSFRLCAKKGKFKYSAVVEMKLPKYYSSDSSVNQRAFTPLPEDNLTSHKSLCTLSTVLLPSGTRGRNVSAGQTPLDMVQNPRDWWSSSPCRLLYGFTVMWSPISWRISHKRNLTSHLFAHLNIKERNCILCGSVFHNL